MKNLQFLMLCMLVCGLSDVATAQQRTPRNIEEKVSRSIQFLVKHTQATEDQQNLAKPIYSSYFVSLDSLKQLGEMSSNRKAVLEVQQTRNNKLAAFLTDAQMQQLKEAEKEALRQRRQRQQHR